MCLQGFACLLAIAHIVTPTTPSWMLKVTTMHFFSFIIGSSLWVISSPSLDPCYSFLHYCQVVLAESLSPQPLFYHRLSFRCIECLSSLSDSIIFSVSCVILESPFVHFLSNLVRLVVYNCHSFAKVVGGSTHHSSFDHSPSHSLLGFCSFKI